MKLLNYLRTPKYSELSMVVMAIAGYAAGTRSFKLCLIMFAISFLKLEKDETAHE